MTNKHKQILKNTRLWIEDFILKLSICPFAAKPYEEGKIQFFISSVGDNYKEIQDLFLKTLLNLNEDPSISNAFIIIEEDCSFDDYLNIYYFLEDLLKLGKLDSTFQLASFHPEYMYDGTEKDDPSNYRNRSPYSMIHILRVSEVEMAIDKHGDTTEITNRNIELLSQMDVKEFNWKLNKME